MYYTGLIQYIYTLDLWGGNPDACMAAIKEDPVTFLFPYLLVQ